MILVLQNSYEIMSLVVIQQRMMVYLTVIIFQECIESQYLVDLFPSPTLTLSYLIQSKSCVTQVLIQRFVVDLRIGEEVRTGDKVDFISHLAFLMLILLFCIEYHQNIFKIPQFICLLRISCLQSLGCFLMLRAVVVSMRMAFLTLQFQ